MVMSLERIRHEMDAIDFKIVIRMAQRGRLVREAAKYKTTLEQVEAKGQQEQVISNVRRIAEQNGLSPHLVEAVYRTMLAEFVALQRREAGL
jgi:chorismate mutase